MSIPSSSAGSAIFRHRRRWSPFSASPCVEFERIDSGALPDLLFFADDYVALGAFAALHARGITCPKDVKVVTFANKGLGPVGAVSYSRMEVDPVAHGRLVAEQLLRYLGGEKIRRNILLEPDYIVGESFPG